MKWLLLGVMVASTVLGDFLQSREMKRRRTAVDARGLLSALAKSATGLTWSIAIALHGRFVFCLHGAVQLAPLSFAVPASAATLVLETVLARFALGEQVSGHSLVWRPVRLSSAYASPH